MEDIGRSTLPVRALGGERAEREGIEERGGQEGIEERGEQCMRELAQINNEWER